MQAVVCIKWKCTSTEDEIRCRAYEFDSHHLTLHCSTGNLETGLAGGRAAATAMGVCVPAYLSVCVRVCVCVCVCVCVRLCRSVWALWWETTMLSAACCCWQAPTLSAMRRTAASRACRSVSHVPVAPPHLLRFSSSLCAVTQEHLTLTLSILSAYEQLNMHPHHHHHPHPPATLLSTLFWSSEHLCYLLFSLQERRQSRFSVALCPKQCHWGC